MELCEYSEQLKELREGYIRSYPRQRLAVIRQRLEELEPGPNQLLIVASAVEAFARCLVLHAASSDRDKIRDIYARHRYQGPDVLIPLCLEKYGITVEPDEFFGANEWALLGIAIQYRHLLVHECTYLGQDTFPQLIEACHSVLRKLAAVAGLEGRI
jgi:hypothetical protein